MKTRLCWSVNSLGPCPYGTRCTFAHNINEIVCKECNFGDWCNLIMFTEEDGVVNCGDKVCKFKHPSETKEMYFKRLKINIPPSENTSTQYQTNICAPVKKLDWNIQDNKLN